MPLWQDLNVTVLGLVVEEPAIKYHFLLQLAYLTSLSAEYTINLDHVV